jgi:flagellar basal-body rod protein FlgB
MIDTAMTEALSRFLDVNVARYKLITTNMANIDTPGYKARDLNFRQELLRAGAAGEGDASPAGGGGHFSLASFSPVGRKISGLLERPDGNNVNVERESLLLAETQMKFNVGIQLLKDQFHIIAAAINSGGTTS